MSQILSIDKPESRSLEIPNGPTGPSIINLFEVLSQIDKKVNESRQNKTYLVGKSKILKACSTQI